MRKRILCFILAFVMLGSTVPVQAEMIPDTKNTSPARCTVQVMDNTGTIRNVNAIYHLGTWFFTVDFFSAYTDYTFDAKTSRFIPDGDSASTAGKSDDVFRKIVEIDTAGKTIAVKGAVTDLDDVLTIDGTLWLPGCQVLAYLDAGCRVEENILIVSRGRHTFAGLLNGMNLDGDFFDGDSAFGDKLIRKVSGRWAWIWDTLTAFRLERFVPILPFNSDVRDILLGYMTDQDGMKRYASDVSESSADDKSLEFWDKRNKDLQKIMSKGEPISFFTQVLDVNSEKNRSVFFPEEAKDASDKFWEEYKKSGEETKIAGKIQKYGITLFEGAVEYQTNAVSMIDDHVDMLLAVYPDMATKDGKWENEAQILYETYKDKDPSGFGTDFGRNLIDVLINDVVIDEGFDMIFSCVCSAPISGIRMVLGLGNAIVNDFIPRVTKAINEQFGTDIHLYAEAMDDLALMEYYLTALKTAREAYDGYLEDINVNGNYTQENLEKMRLSAIMTLLASKKCFEIMRDNSVNLFATRSQRQAKKTCEAAIDQITGHLAILYAAGAYVLADGKEYFEAAIPEYREQLASLSAMDDTLLKYYWNYMLQGGIAPDSDPYVYMEDINGDGLEELFISDYRTGLEEFAAYSYIDGTIEQIEHQTQEPENGTVKCIFLTEDASGRPGLLTLTIGVDTHKMEKALKKINENIVSYASNPQTLIKLIFNCIDRVDWDFEVFDGRGVNDIPDYGLWKGGKDKPQALLDALARYEGDELLLFRCGDEKIMDLMAGVSVFAHNPVRRSYLFDVFRERYGDKPIPENELGKPVPSVYAGDVSLPAALFEYSALVQTLGLYSEFSYLVRDVEPDGDNELLLYAHDDMEGIATIVTADLNDGTLGIQENGSAAGDLFFTEYTPSGATLIKEYYYSAMNVSVSYYEWMGSEWKKTAFLEEKTQEDASGNWVTTSSGKWWGQEVTSEEFRSKESSETADILRGYSPDMTRIQLSGKADTYREDLRRYLLEERAARFGFDPRTSLAAVGSGDLDLDGVDEEIYVVIRPADPWLAAIRAEQQAGSLFPAEENCSFIVVADPLDDSTLQLIISYHYDDFGGEIAEGDISVSAGVLRVKGAEFAYNGEYLVSMDYIG